ncbi:hypothetical protein L249_0764 [Ophiocordyceps polyrhachis-furcata BCC 54312]|uniref:Dynein light intermediate chain n=1 Tax=Ophiocordyceps polyrhachis-furcata BCC 54312 TaxID=1330021 RepID=A0A367LER7_9HYPO|nr:hypothetical protein L249_0764 [Ophiocordyceps polyrhachis-furcata BCC 54312]
MAGGDQRGSTYTSRSTDSNGPPPRNLWTSMLESVASGKRLPDKNILVLGGTPESQRDFIDSLYEAPSKRSFDRQANPPVANSFALGYTYYDVLDADQDDTLARVSIYLLSQPSAEFAPLVSPLLTPEAIPNTALVVLLDWAQPHLWLRQLWSWIQVLEQVMRQTSTEARKDMENVMASWKERGRGGAAVNLDGTTNAIGTAGDGDGLLPVGPGEWTDPLGLPLCVVCQNAQRMEFLERNKGWREPDFDTVLQYLRTVLLRHGASLIYTSQNTPSQLPVLLHSTLGITSLLKRQPLKHNVIDRDQIVVAPNWDSWGKIRILGGTFDAELVSRGWEEDINLPAGSSPPSMEEEEEERDEDDDDDDDDDKENGVEDVHHASPARNPSAIAQYESWCRDPNSGGLAVVESAMDDGSAVATESEDPQAFLERQLKILEAFKAKAPLPDKQADSNNNLTASRRLDLAGDEKSVHDHIGPVQCNMGGIQVDADDMLQRLKANYCPLSFCLPTMKDRNARVASSSPPDEGDMASPIEGLAKEYDTEQLQNFFTGLMNRTTGSGDSPRS